MLTISRFLDSSRFVSIWLLAALLIAILAPNSGCAAKETRDPDRATLLALGNWDSSTDYRRPPHGGKAVLLLNSRGKLVRQIPKFTVNGGFGGCRGISASQDGRFFVVCGNSEEGISMYRVPNGVKLWSLSGFFRSAVFADGLVYALGAESVYAIDHTGTIVKHSRTGVGMDIVFDPLAKCLWIVGMDIRKYSLDLKLQFKVKLPFGISYGGAFSVDVNPDGSVWVAGKNVFGREGDENRLIKVSPTGQLLKVIDLDFCPQRVRVDRSDGSVWTTGKVRRHDYSRVNERLEGGEWPETTAELDALIITKVQTHTRKYDSEGELLVKNTQGGTSIEVDPSDGSVWVAGGRSILHYSSTGANLATYDGVSGSQKWLAIVP
jgi:DNA-binding beta-propeller fold protein YncE